MRASRSLKGSKTTQDGNGPMSRRGTGPYGASKMANGGRGRSRSATDRWKRTVNIIEVNMNKWMSGVRGSILMIALWVVGWGLGFGGIMELVDPDGKIQD